MPDYRYQGTSRSGGSVSGVMTASNKTELASLLKRQQITATKMTEKGKEFNIPTFGGGVNSKELAIFTRQFSVMIDAGLPLVQCLEILAGQQENKFFQGLGGDAWPGRRRRHAFCCHADFAEGIRRLVREHGRGWRNRRYSGHHSAASVHLH